MNQSKVKCFFQRYAQANCASTGLLLVRLVVGIAFILHGWGKIQTPMSWMGPDAPVPGALQLLAAISEFGGGIALVFGLLTSLAMLGMAITMAVAVYTHAVVKGDPFVGGYELALVYLAIAVMFIVVGPGKFSLDHKIFGTKEK